MLNSTLENTIKNFDIPKASYDFVANENGLINKSYRVIREGHSRYFLQQIDHTIFKNIEGLMNNIEKVTNHLKNLENGPNYLTLIYTHNRKSFFKSDKGEYWRLYEYFEGETFIKADNNIIAKEAGKALGHFLSSLASLNPTSISVTIPKFHDINNRFNQFNSSLTEASEQRLRKAAVWVNLVKTQIDFVKEIFAHIISNCPQRISHNDTKLSNLLFNENHEAICVIDYDTLMPGYIPLDFGDSIRTICSTTEEDDPNYEGTFYNMDLYKSFTQSFKKSLSAVITKEELEILPKMAAYMPFIMGLRMLTDFLNNDIYYATNYEDHNLDRAANQLTLFTNAVSLENEMRTIINT